MTVEELINRLEQVPKDMMVRIVKSKSDFDGKLKVVASDVKKVVRYTYDKSQPEKE